MLDKSPQIVAAATGLYISSVLFFCAGFFTVVSPDLARFFSFDELTPLFLPAFLSFLFVVVLLIGVWALGEVWRRAKIITTQTKAYTDQFSKKVAVYQLALGFLYLGVVFLAPLHYANVALSLAAMIKLSVDDLYEWLAVTDSESKHSSWLPTIAFVFAWAFHQGEMKALSFVDDDLRGTCVKVVVGDTQRYGVVLLQTDSGLLIFNAEESALEIVDKNGQLLDQRPFRKDRSLVGSVRQAPWHERLLRGFQCMARLPPGTVAKGLHGL